MRTAVRVSLYIKLYHHASETYEDVVYWLCEACPAADWLSKRQLTKNYCHANQTLTLLQNIAARIGSTRTFSSTAFS